MILPIVCFKKSLNLLLAWNCLLLHKMKNFVYQFIIHQVVTIYLKFLIFWDLYSSCCSNLLYELCWEYCMLCSLPRILGKLFPILEMLGVGIVWNFVWHDDFHSCTWSLWRELCTSVFQSKFPQLVMAYKIRYLEKYIIFLIDVFVVSFLPFWYTCWPHFFVALLLAFPL